MCRFLCKDYVYPLQIVIIGTILLTHVFSGNAYAQMEIEPDKIKFSPFFLSPSFLITEAYTDNVFFERTDKDNDFITIFSPGMEFLLTPLHRHNILLKYTGVFTRHADQYTEDTNKHKADGMIEFNLRGGLTIKALGSYIKDHEPRGSSSTGVIEQFETNNAAASATYGLRDRFKLKADYAHSDLDFKRVESSFRDREEDIASGTVFYRFLPRTSALMEYGFTHVDYGTVADLNNDINSFLLGIAWEITLSSIGEIKAGYLEKDFDSPLRDDFKGSVFSIDIDHRLTESTSVKLLAHKKVNESNLAGPNYFTTKGFSAEVGHMFTREVSCITVVSYGVDKYNTAITVGTMTDVREDKLWKAGVGLRYRIQEWLEVGMDYLYTDRNSNFDDLEYEENTYSLMANFVM